MLGTAFNTHRQQHLSRALDWNEQSYRQDMGRRLRFVGDRYRRNDELAEGQRCLETQGWSQQSLTPVPDMSE